MDRRALALASILALAALPAHAQDDTDAGTAAGPPTFSGRDRATGTVSSDHGAVFELGNGARLVIPPGNRISHSQTMTFSSARGAIRPASVATGFMRQGPPLAFDSAIDARAAPIELSIRMHTAPSRPGMKLVLAMEEPGLCDATHTERLTGPLCSHWSLVDATFQDGRVMASIPTPGGYRLQFGLVPVPDEGHGDEARGIP